MSLEIYTRSVLALVAVLALLLLCAWLARRFGMGMGPVARRGARRLAIVETTPLDGKRRLMLLRRDDTEHLVLLAGDSVVVIERGIRPPPAEAAPGFAAMVEEPEP
jgi:flagellar protein FliO/FliZ